MNTNKTLSVIIHLNNSEAGVGVNLFYDASFIKNFPSFLGESVDEVAKASDMDRNDKRALQRFVSEEADMIFVLDTKEFGRVFFYNKNDSKDGVFGVKINGRLVRIESKSHVVNMEKGTVTYRINESQRQRASDKFRTKIMSMKEATVIFQKESENVEQSPVKVEVKSKTTEEKVEVLDFFSNFGNGKITSRVADSNTVQALVLACKECSGAPTFNHFEKLNKFIIKHNDGKQKLYNLKDNTVEKL